MAKKVNSTELGASYFLTEEGKSAWRAATGDEITAESLNEVSAQLSRAVTREIDAKVLSKLQGNSISHFESTVAQQFIDNNFQGDQLPELDLLTLYKNPEVIAEKLKGFYQLKEYLRSVKRDITGSEQLPEKQQHGQLKMVDIYTKRINFFIAEQYKSAYKLLRQYQLSGGEVHSETIEALEAAVPGFKKDMSEEQIAIFLQRLDRYKYGVGIDEDGKFTWKSREAAVQMERAGNTETVTLPETARGQYTDISPEQLKSVKIDSEQIAAMITDVLESYGYLSSEPASTWSPEREGPANDGKWQVIISGESKV